MIISNYKSIPHYFNVQRKYEYSKQLQFELTKFLKQYLKRYQATQVISDFSPIFGFAMIEAAYQLKIPCTSYLPFMKYSITWNDDLRERFDNLFNKTKIIYTDTREYGAWRYRYNYENIVNHSDVILFNKPPTSLDSNDKHIVRYARMLNKRVDNIYKELEAVYTSFRIEEINYAAEMVD